MGVKLTHAPLAAFAGVLLLPLTAGCVAQVRYDRLVGQAAQAKVEAEAKQRDLEARIQSLQADLSAAEAATQDRDAKVSDLSTANHNFQAQVDEQTAMNEQLRGELGRLGKDVDKILAEKGTLSQALDDARARLDELRKAQAAREARVAIFQDFERRFKPLIDGGQLRIETRRGQLIMVVQSDLLFDAGRAEVRGAGKGILMEIARTLQLSSPAPAAPATQAGRRYLVTANLDAPGDGQARPVADAKARQREAVARVAEPRKGAHPLSPWELSVTQAVSVVEYLVSLGVQAETLTAAGAGSFDPIEPNDDAAGRAKNRRVEIAMLPTADETVSAK